MLTSQYKEFFSFWGGVSGPRRRTAARGASEKATRGRGEVDSVAGEMPTEGRGAVAPNARGQTRKQDAEEHEGGRRRSWRGPARRAADVKHTCTVPVRVRIAV